MLQEIVARLIEKLICPGGGIDRRGRLKICNPKGMLVQAPYRIPFYKDRNYASNKAFYFEA